jgi:hypothetical protein
VQAHVRHVEHVVAAERIPRIHHAVVAARDVDAGREQLLRTMFTPVDAM